LERLHDERLKRAPDRPARVVQDALGGARAAVVQQRARVEADPLAARRSPQVDREVGVDEQEAVERQRRAHAVAEVRGRDQPRVSGVSRLARQERVAQAHPHPPGP
jgi:hypothetical protein